MQCELTSLSFFSGCLGLDFGLEQAGIKQVFACEIDSACAATIRKNRPKLPVFSNILDLTAAQIRSVAGLKQGQSPTLMVGGPPCQAFSTAGKRQAFMDPRGNVFLRYVSLIEELLPEYAVIENVRGLLSASLKHVPHKERTKTDACASNKQRAGSALAFVIQWLERIGYGISFNLYNAANFGVPQVRERVILIAARSGKKVPYLTPTHSDDPKLGLPAWKTFRQAVEGLNEKEMIGLTFPEKRLRYYRLLTEGQYWKHLPENLQREALGKSYESGGGKTGFLRRLAWDKPSPTLVTHPAMPATDLAHPVHDRPLSIQEYKRLQQFPDGWEISGRLLEQYRQLGNAVPAGLGRAVGKMILDHINGDIPFAVAHDFRYSRYKNTDDTSWRKCFIRQEQKTQSQQLLLL